MTDLVKIWDRLDRRTRVGLFPSGQDSPEEMNGLDYLVAPRSKTDIFGFWKRSEWLRCNQGKPMKDMDFGPWNRAVSLNKSRTIDR